MPGFLENAGPLEVAAWFAAGPIILTLLGGLGLWVQTRLLGSLGIRIRQRFGILRYAAKAAPWIVPAALVAIAAGVVLGEGPPGLVLAALGGLAASLFACLGVLYVLAQRLGLQTQHQRVALETYPRKDGKTLSQKGALAMLSVVACVTGTASYGVGLVMLPELRSEPFILWGILFLLAIGAGGWIQLRQPSSWKTGPVPPQRTGGDLDGRRERA